MDYWDEHLRRGEHSEWLACSYNQHEDSFGVMPQCVVPEISGYALGLVEPAVQRQVVKG
jgi:hypothetical protein